jgi:metal-dependent HD superfamily phosphatase/phosphodiesterase
VRWKTLSRNILRVPYGKNEKLKTLMRKISEDFRIQTFWRCANVMAIDRMGYSDHGPTHVKIVANSALKILRILIKRGVVPNVVKDYGLTDEDAEVVVVLASVLHDLGMAVEREKHDEHSIFLSMGFLESYLGSMYDEVQAVILTSEALHALSTHHHQMRPLTIEAGVVRVADAVDMEQGRARIPFEAGKINIHSVSALSIERVKIEEGVEKPVMINISMTGSAGIFQVDELLRNKIRNSGLENYIHVIAKITGEKEATVIERFEI